MPLTQVMQAPGHWSIELDGDRLPVPRALTDLFPVATEGFGHIVVTSAQIDAGDLTPNVLLQLATYVGRYIGQKGRTTLYGDHINAWLGDAEGKSRLLAELTVDQGFTAWIDDIQADQDPFYQGNIGTPGFTFNYTHRDNDSQRATLDAICKWFGCEWRVRNTMQFDADIWTNLYGATPTAIATPWWDGADTELTGIRADIETDANVERYAAVIAGTGAGGTFTSVSEINSFTGPLGDYYLQTGLSLSGASQIADADLTTFLTAEAQERWALDPTLKIRTDDFCPLDSVAVGAPLYVFDPDADVYDFDNEIHYGGHMLWPKILRVQAIVDMPVRKGMGVYFATGRNDALTAGTEQIFDLTDYVKWETGTTRIEVGERVRTLRPAMKRKGYDA